MRNDFDDETFGETGSATSRQSRSRDDPLWGTDSVFSFWWCRSFWRRISRSGANRRQEGQAQGPPITVHVKVVNVLATVRDKKGAIVRDLNQDDFELKEDDRPQTIRYFSHETDLPLTLGLLVDTSMSQRRVLGEERDASATFLDQVLRVDKDQAFIIHFDREVELLQDLTSSRQKLQAALALLQTPQRSRKPVLIHLTLGRGKAAGAAAGAGADGAVVAPRFTMLFTWLRTTSPRSRAGARP